MRSRHFLTFLAASLATSPLAAQTDRPGALAEFVGTYRYHGEGTLTMAAGDSLLYAVIDEAKYALRPVGRDRFVNGPGDTIPFRRDALGKVDGFTEGGRFFARLSRELDSATAQLMQPRPPGAPYAYRPPADMGDGIAVGGLAEAGLDESVARAIVDGVVRGRFADLHGVLVYRGGKLVLEEYFYGYHAGRPHAMRSATKSVVSALVGIAIDRGALPGVEERILPRLPYAAYANPHPAKAALTLGDLLTHRTGLACDDWDDGSPGNENRVYASDDWVKFFLDLPVAAERGTTARYCSAGVLTAGRLVERATGQALPAFAQHALFAPLGIRAGDVRWNFALAADNAGSYAQLHLRPRDMLKLGILFRQEGMWRGRRVISRDWVRRSTAQHSRVGDQGYGYLWWHQYLNVPTARGNQRVDMVVATGNGGQKIILVPALDLVAVFTGGAYNADNTPPNAVMRQILLPALLTAR